MLTEVITAPVTNLDIQKGPAPDFILRRKLHGFQERIVQIAWSPSGKLLALPSFDETIYVWNEKSRCFCKLYFAVTERQLVVLLGLQMDDYLLQVHKINQYSFGTIEKVKYFRTSGGILNLSDKSYGLQMGKKIASSADDNSIKIWNLETGG